MTQQAETAGAPLTDQPGAVAGPATAAVGPLPDAPVAIPVGPGRSRAVRIARRVVLGLLGLGLFVTALSLMKAGAVELIPALEGSVFTDNPWSTLGLGWLGACLVLSGSPVAASSLSLLGGGAIDASQSFTMLTGSRLGASFVVLVVGVLYAVRRDRVTRRKAPLSVGVLSLFMTVVAYLPGALIGWLLLSRGALDGVNLTASPGLLSITDTMFGWAVDAVAAVLPGWGLFPVGVGVLLLAFKAFDAVLPTIGSETLAQRDTAWYTRTWPMFGLGCLVALLTLSVSVALTVLVPLVARGYLRREHALPYIAGANITTLADTLVAAILIAHPDAPRVVLAEVLGVGVWTLVLLAFLFPAVRSAALRTADAALASPRRLALSLGVLFTVPVALIAV